MRSFLGFIFLFSVACGNDQSSWGTDTWGSASEDIAKSYCDTLGDCVSWSDDDKYLCFIHNVSHFCELADTCYRNISMEFQESVAECVADIPSQDCFTLAWGIMPMSCEGVLTAPEEQ